MHTGLWWGSLGEKTARKPRHRWKDYYKINLQEMGWEDIMDWVNLAQDRNTWQDLVNAVMKHHVGDNVRNFLVS
jgi:hypothetical protein